MSREITNTVNKYPNRDIGDGTHDFKVLEITKKYGAKGGEYFVWKLEYGGDLGLIGEQILLPNMMGELLKVLKCKETDPGQFDWDTNEQTGKNFVATVSHKPDVKDPTKIRQHMGNFKPEGIPF